VSAPVQAALPILLEARHAFQARMHQRIADNLAWLERACRAGPAGRNNAFEPLPADGGWVTLLRMPDTRSDEAWAIELLADDVITHPGHFYDADAEPLLVVSLIVEAKTFESGLSRIAAAAGSPAPPAEDGIRKVT